MHRSTRAGQIMREAKARAAGDVAWTPPVMDGDALLAVDDGAGPAQAESQGDVSEPVAGSVAVEPPVVPIVDAPEPLQRGAPPTIVRDAVGGVSLEVADANLVSGRRRHNVAAVVGLQWLGAPLLQAIIDRCGGGEGDFKSYVAAARTLATAMADMGIAALPVTALPANLVEAAGGEWERRRGLPLGGSQNERLNFMRTLLRLVPGTGHMKLDRVFVQDDLPPHWRLGEDGEVVVSGKFVHGDVEIERLVKRCSIEVRRTVAAWNQLVAFLDGDVKAAGPNSSDAVAAAALLLRVDPGLPAYWSDVCVRDDADFQRFYRVGWEAVAAAAAGGSGEASPEPQLAGLIAMMEDARVRGLDAAAFAREHPNQVRMFVRQGWRAAVRIAFPTSGDIVAPATLMGTLTRFNAGLLGKMPLTGLKAREAHWTELEDGVGAHAAPERLHGSPYKPRARRLQPVDFPVTEEIEDPAPLIEFLTRWTAGMRDHADRYADRLFIYVSGNTWRGGVQSFANVEAVAFRRELRRLCARAGIAPITPRMLRPIGIDIIHERTAGDPMLVHASGNWATDSLAETRYVTAPAIRRDQERLYWSGRLVERERDWDIILTGRPLAADRFSATDGFRCGNPLDSPDGGEPGGLCHARGLCAICPHGDLDTAHPAWSFARLVGLADHISRTIAAGARPSWERRYRPVLAELLDVWLPLFPDEVVEAARRQPVIPYSELPDVET